VAPPRPGGAVTVPYYQDDQVTLYHGDCREITEWLAADVLCTDPPYGIDYSTGWGGRAFGDGRVTGDATTETRDSALTLWDSRPAVVFASFRCQPFGQPHRMPLIFDKGDVVGMGDLSWPWRPSYEMAWVYGSGWVGPRSPAVLRHRVLPGNFTARDHPTQKPVSLMEDVLRHAPPGTIADPFVGSGSTLIAARNLGRRAIGVELEERYAETAARRLSQMALPL
jgi:site-specific DNA-methyltransferase (adenine-specific)